MSLGMLKVVVNHHIDSSGSTSTRKCEQTFLNVTYRNADGMHVNALANQLPID
jgi:hypothetical protein